MSLFLGIDFGTSGARAIAIDHQAKVQVEVRCPYQIRDVWSWKQALFNLIWQIPQPLKSEIVAIAIDATSATVLLCDRQGEPMEPPILYNDTFTHTFIDSSSDRYSHKYSNDYGDRGGAIMATLQAIAPADSIVLSSTSSLAKLLWLRRYSKALNAHNGSSSIQNYCFLHQADWLAFLLHGRLGISDYHNALKLGYDIDNLCYPDWLNQLDLAFLLPDVLIPGSYVGHVTPEIVLTLGLNPDCWVCAGTTDSNAAFLASGAESPGDAVTSLGSTIVLKLLSRTRLDAPRYGIYSHRFSKGQECDRETLWLVGGASNTGGAVLRQLFTDTQLTELSDRIDPSVQSQLDYYPLTKPGERFPICDPVMLPRLQPRPPDDALFLHGLLESMAKIEARGYELLQELGATKITRLYSMGGGAANPTWTAIRARYLPVPFVSPLHTHTEAAFGSALLARRSY